MVTDSKSGNHRGINATATFRIMQYVLPTNLHALVLLIPTKNYIMMGNVKDANGLTSSVWPRKYLVQVSPSRQCKTKAQKSVLRHSW